MKFTRLTGDRGENRFINMDHVVDICRESNDSTTVYLDYYDTINNAAARIFVKETPEQIMIMIGQNRQ